MGLINNPHFKMRRSPKNLLNFGRPKTAFSPREMSQRLETSEGLKIGGWYHVTSVICSAFTSNSGHCIVFWQGFVELTDVFDFKILLYNY